MGAGWSRWISVRAHGRIIVRLLFVAATSTADNHPVLDRTRGILGICHVSFKDHILLQDGGTDFEATSSAHREASHADGAPAQKGFPKQTVSVSLQQPGSRWPQQLQTDMTVDGRVVFCCCPNVKRTT